MLAALDGPRARGRHGPARGRRRARRVAEPGLMAMGSGRYFGFVIGGALPASLAADWLVSAWDQNAGSPSRRPPSSALEAVAGRWVLELLGLPAHSSFAFVTGCQMAHVTSLAAARQAVYSGSATTSASRARRRAAAPRRRRREAPRDAHPRAAAARDRPRARRSSCPSTPGPDARRASRRRARRRRTSRRSSARRPAR